MKIKQILKEVYYCPYFLIEKIGKRFIPISFALLLCISMIWISIFDWIGLNVLFSLPISLAHFYSFLYLALYKELKKR